MTPRGAVKCQEGRGEENRNKLLWCQQIKVTFKNTRARVWLESGERELFSGIPAEGKELTLPDGKRVEKKIS